MSKYHAGAVTGVPINVGMLDNGTMGRAASEFAAGRTHPEVPQVPLNGLVLRRVRIQCEQVPQRKWRACAMVHITYEWGIREKQRARPAQKEHVNAHANDNPKCTRRGPSRALLRGDWRTRRVQRFGRARPSKRREKHLK